MENQPALDLMTRAKETYSLETSIGSEHDEALAAVVTCITEAVTQQNTEELAQLALLYATDMDQAESASQLPEFIAVDDGEETILNDGPGALMWFARQLLDKLPPESEISKYEPTDGDLVQLIVAGTVVLGPEPGMFSVFTEDTDTVIDFDAGNVGEARFRLLYREGSE
jgi:hypothetical protein